MLYKIVGYCILVRVIQTYLDPIAFTIKSGDLNLIVVYVIIGLACWLAYEIVKKIVGLLTLPFAWMSFGLLGLVINVILVYLIQYAINHSGLGIVLISPEVTQALGFAGMMTLYSIIMGIFL